MKHIFALAVGIPFFVSSAPAQSANPHDVVNDVYFSMKAIASSPEFYTLKKDVKHKAQNHPTYQVRRRLSDLRVTEYFNGMEIIRKGTYDRSFNGKALLAFCTSIDTYSILQITQPNSQLQKDVFQLHTKMLDATNLDNNDVNRCPNVYAERFVR